jgi:dihydrodipicolinate synthase/N-acetylneuraminate lyase
MQGVIEHQSVRQPLPSLTSEGIEAVRQGLSGAGSTVQERR